MKLIMATLAVLVTSMAFSQGDKQGPGKPPPPEKRWEKDSEKIKKAVTLTADELTRVKAAFMDFYKEMDALHEKSKGQRPAKEAVDKIITKRNEAVKKAISKEKFDKYSKVEKELGPPRPPKE